MDIFQVSISFQEIYNRKIIKQKKLVFCIFIFITIRVYWPQKTHKYTDKSIEMKLLAERGLCFGWSAKTNHKYDTLVLCSWKLASSFTLKTVKYEKTLFCVCFLYNFWNSHEFLNIKHLFIFVLYCCLAATYFELSKSKQII